MGHLRLGTIPKTKRWSQVLASLSEGAPSIPGLARAVVEAARDAYLNASGDPGVGESLRLLAVLASSSRSDDFREALASEGFTVRDDTDAVRFLRDFFIEADRRFGPNDERSIFTEFASLALREALTETVSSQTGTLFTAGVADVQEAYRQFSTERGFARLARLFFARLLSHSLLYFTDKRIASELGESGGVGDEAELLEVQAAVRSYAYEASRIVEDYAAAWYSKSRWLQRERRTAGFAGTAMRKLAAELAQAQ